MLPSLHFRWVKDLAARKLLAGQLVVPNRKKENYLSGLRNGSRDTQGSRDIGDSLILNTQVVTLMKTSGCWWLLWPKSSPKSYICHQHILSPTSVTNIDVTFRLGRWIFYSTRFKTSKNKKSKFDDQYFESEESWDIQSQLHLLCPSITENGTISTKIRRLVEHTMHLELSCFLLDHSREREALFKKLQGIIHRWYT